MTDGIAYPTRLAFGAEEAEDKRFTEPVALSSTASIDLPPSGLAAFRVQPLETTSTYSRSVLGAHGNLANRRRTRRTPADASVATSGKSVWRPLGGRRRPRRLVGLAYATHGCGPSPRLTSNVPCAPYGTSPSPRLSGQGQGGAMTTQVGVGTAHSAGKSRARKVP